MDEKVIITLVTIFISAVFASLGYLLKSFHSQAMEKFDLMIGSVSSLEKTLVVHDEKLGSGAKQFEKMEENHREFVKVQNDHDKRLTILEQRGK